MISLPEKDIAHLEYEVDKSGFNVSSTVEEEFKSYFIPSPISLLVFPYSIGSFNDFILFPSALADKYGNNSVFLLNSTSGIFILDVI